MISRERTRYGVIHCSDTPGTMDMDIVEVHRWHLARGIRSSRGTFSGYHGLIRRGGDLELGRHMDEIGAHCRGINQDSVSVCLSGGRHGKDNFTEKQWVTLRRVVQFWQTVWPEIEILGHRDFNKHKTCPGFDVHKWMVRAGLKEIA